ncbi:FCD domain-containing protein [Streptomyces sp. NBC_00841]|uniref:FadR/GntR family transcriptional regulator n=1 Tax=unclassified Streptomyces TaxID=2593676 RepID=UPI00225016D0|nr:MULTISPECIES: FCD domain-containing protein [unclassified Streptomyces]MCX4531366.1 FCD domain-containing protein [Streptomyces sp. NBC_01669]WSA03052.1 FCD domain-containing protein [Streptomyces sp. NBC_00841]
MTLELSSSFQSASTRGGYRPGYEIAAERILEYIVKERLSPGTRLPTEKDLADAVQMSRTVVREAVKILSAVGRLSVQKGRGIYVADPEGAQWRESFSQFLPADLRQVDEMFEFRRYVETATARLAAQRAAPTQVNAIREAAVRSMEAALDSDIEAFTRADEGFHGAIGAAASNMFFGATVDSVRYLQRQVSAIGLAGVAGGSLVVAAEQHQAIAAAIAFGDDEQAESLMAGHIDMTVSQFRRAIRKRLLPDGDASS